MKGKTTVSRILAVAAMVMGFTISASAQLTIHQILPEHRPTIDGDISEWTSLGAPHLMQSQFSSTTGTVQGLVPEEDQKVEVWLGWSDDEDLVYVAARVTDDSFVAASASQPWTGDDFEVYLDADNSGGRFDAANPHAQQHAFSPDFAADPVALPATARVKVQSAAQREGTVYTYEIAISGWNVTAGGTGEDHDFQLDQVIGLTVAFSDFESGESGYHAFNGLNGPVGAWGDADQFTDFQLIGPAERPVVEPPVVEPPVVEPPVTRPIATGGFFNEVRVMESRPPRRGFAVSSGPVGGRAELTSRSKPTTLQVKSWGEIKAQIEEQE
jgi:hypothetical protein